MDEMWKDIDGSIHLKRKRYTHKYQYELDKLLKNVRDTQSQIYAFKEKYPDVYIDEMIEELKESRNGK